MIQNDKEADKEALEYSDSLLKVGEGKLERTNDYLISLPTAVNIVDSVTDLVQSVFQNLEKRYEDVEWLTSQTILTTTNSRLQCINDQVAELLPGTFLYYRSAESVVCDSIEAQNAAELRYLQELFNSIELGSSLPEHEVSLKKGFIYMLLRNIKTSVGHVNGARYLGESMTPNLLFLRSLFGSRKGARLILPRMNCAISKDDFPIPGFRRCQFPIRVCFAMTINKAQGQWIPGTLGIDLHGQCFSQGQLYVTLSRTNPKNVFVCTADGNKKTKNDVFTEILHMQLNFSADLNVVLPENPCNQQAKGNQMDLAYLLNPEILSPNPVSAIFDALSVIQVDEISFYLWS